MTPQFKAKTGFVAFFVTLLTQLSNATNVTRDTDIKALIRTVPDFPKPGVLFRDITTLLKDADGFNAVVEKLAAPYRERAIDKIAGIESRGFIIGAALAYELNVGFVPVRKSGKLPAENFGHDYELEYGADRLEIHRDAIQRGERVLLVDDLIATGGTAEGAIKLLRQVGAEVLAACFIIDLPELGGAEKLRKLNVPVRTLISFAGH